MEIQKMWNVEKHKIWYCANRLKHRIPGRQNERFRENVILTNFSRLIKLGIENTGSARKRTRLEFKKYRADSVSDGRTAQWS